jgi:membrane protein YdbS with pleckstrin-like domain
MTETRFQIMILLVLGVVLVAIVVQAASWLRQNFGAPVLAAGLAVVAAFAWLVWPTPCRYDHIDFDGAQHVVRINRLTVL